MKKRDRNKPRPGKTPGLVFFDEFEQMTDERWEKLKTMRTAEKDAKMFGLASCLIEAVASDLLHPCTSSRWNLIDATIRAASVQGEVSGDRTTFYKLCELRMKWEEEGCHVTRTSPDKDTDPERPMDRASPGSV